LRTLIRLKSEEVRNAIKGTVSNNLIA